MTKDMVGSSMTIDMAGSSMTQTSMVASTRC